MNDTKRVAVEVLIAGEWTKAVGIVHDTGWCSWSMNDGTNGLSKPGNWRLRHKQTKGHEDVTTNPSS